MTTHSPLGFSGADRWSKCAGSPALIAGLAPGAGEADPEYTAAGKAAHAAAAYCLERGEDAWQTADIEFEDAPGYKLNSSDLVSVQTYIDNCRSLLELTRNEHDVFELVEHHHEAPAIHPLARGTLDYGLVSVGLEWATIVDYKHGEGIPRDPAWDWQIMGYACLLLDEYPTLMGFDLYIDQPRCEPYNGPRKWVISADDLIEWRDTELIPAMNIAGNLLKDAVDPQLWLHPGDHCRFCKAGKALACSASLKTLAVVTQSAPVVERLSDASLAELAANVEPAKIACRNIMAEVERRHLRGGLIAGFKTVLKRAFRQWKPGAELALRGYYGHAVYTEPELKSPAQIEDMPNGKSLVQRWAFTPDNGYTVAPLTGRGKAVTVQTAQQKYEKHIDKSGKTE